MSKYNCPKDCSNRSTGKNRKDCHNESCPTWVEHMKRADKIAASRHKQRLLDAADRRNYGQR